MNYKDEIKKIIKDHNGTLLTADLTAHNIPRTYLMKLVNEGIIEQVSRGVYVSTDAIEDSLYYLQCKYPKIIYSHETALFFHSLTDRTPSLYTATVPSGYKVVNTLSENCKIYYIQKKYHFLGLSYGTTSFGNTVKIYDKERTICDILRNRNSMDSQVMSDGLKRYVRLDTIDLSKLSEYAKLLRVEKTLTTYLEVLL
jgi:predicted transcriptional regulator of viral defense system